ncbi:VOC family protein, partial [Bordetella petrii]|uniref:VOC family protein n=1 Tax=Bordetella petrii TaxID=94624 RepID=UPI001E466E39
MKTLLDHIAVAAPDLASGADWVERALGVRPQRGGAHPRMGTHNLLLRLGPDVYLEVIAP